MISIDELLHKLSNDRGAEFVSLGELLDMFEDQNDIVFGELSKSIQKNVPRDEYFVKECTRKINRALRDVLCDVLETLVDAGAEDIEHRENHREEI